MTSGILNILKPPGMTSHDVVAFVRRTFGLKKVGHAGTLDPAAAGVLPVFLGQATRLIEYSTDADKAYRAELTFGYATDTGDDTGQTITVAEGCLPPLSEIDEILHSFVGTIEQIPPMHSAIKVGGKKLYELAREGREIERQPRTVFIKDIRLITAVGDKLLFDVTCSKGTYIRTLCADIGVKAGCPAVMSFLVRTRVGGFTLAEAKTLEEITLNREACLLPYDYAITHLPKAVLSQASTLAFRQGQTVPLTIEGEGDTWRVYDEAGMLLGIGRMPARGGMLSPAKVLANND